MTVDRLALAFKLLAAWLVVAFIVALILGHYARGGTP